MPKSSSSQAVLDTSVIVAALQSWHEHHESAWEQLTEVLASGSAALPARVLVEAFSVMTRMPAPHRLSPQDAFTLLESTFKGSTPLLQLASDAYWPLLEALAKDGIGGGTVYDAEIVACAQEAGAQQILTLNRRHFERLVPDRIRVLPPGDGPSA